MAIVPDKSENSPANGAEQHIPSGSKTALTIADGVTAPTAVEGYAQLYVDAADGDLKIIFGDGTVKTIVAD